MITPNFNIDVQPILKKSVGNHKNGIIDVILSHEGIKKEMFINNQNLVRISIPSNVSSIEKRAFYNCHSLKEIKYHHQRIQLENLLFISVMI